MTPEQFAYWLQGFAELNNKQPTPEQWVMIMQHLQTVFVKVTPPLMQPFKMPWSLPVTPTFPSYPERPWLDTYKVVCSTDSIKKD